MATATPNYPNKLREADGYKPPRGQKYEILLENRCEGLYEPENAIYGLFFRFSAPTGAKMA